MSETIFRQKSLDQIKSPENLNDYVHVSNPSVWLLLISMILLLIGACVWGIFGYIDNTIEADIHVEDGVAVCYIKEAYVDSLSEGMVVKTQDSQGIISEIGALEDHGYPCIVSMEPSLEEGLYPAEIVLQQINPISFILN